MNWHQLSTTKIFELLGADSQGLSSIDAEEKLLQYGPNLLPEGQKKSIAAIFLAQFKDVMTLILLGAAVISGIIGDLTDTIVILVIVILNAILGFFQEYRAEKAMQALKKMAATTATVLRKGALTWLPAAELVPGDIILLEAGNAVSADIRIIDSFHLKIDEASLTGESNAVEKVSHAIDGKDVAVADQVNMAFKGTFVSYGRGKGIVVATGKQTEMGRIAGMLQEKEALTPLQQRLASFGKRLSLLVLFLCLLFLGVGLLRGEHIIKIVLTSISLAVAAIPEALPAVITISLALLQKK